MTPEQLKNSILQLAIEGKLVPQNSAEGTGQDLLKQIKAALASPGQGRGTACGGRVKPLAPVIPEDQPFVIPDTWCWCRLGEISYKIFAGGDKPEIFSENKNEECVIPVIANGETNEGVIGYTNEATVKEVSLTISGRGTIGFSCVREEPFCPIVRLLVVIPSKFVDIKFLKLLLNVLIEKGNGTSVKQLTVPMIVPKILPLPPLAEQKRIVAKLEELLPLVEEYGKYYNRLQELNKSFPGKLKKSLLQLAIEGKLVPQNPAEGTGQDLLKQIKAALASPGQGRGTACGGRVKPLAPVTSEDQPFVIPDTWCWCRLGEVLNAYSGLSYNKSNLEKHSDNMITVFRGGNILDLHYKFKNDDVVISKEFIKKDSLYLKSGQLITPAVTSLEMIGKVALIDRDFDNVVAGGFVLNLVPVYKNMVLSKYLLYYFGSFFMKKRCKEIAHKSGQAFYNLSREKLLMSILPLPPLAEQKRIVAKLEELLPLCEELGG